MRWEDILALFRIELHEHSDLPKVVQTRDAIGLVFSFRQRRQQHRGENGDDGDDHEQFDQGEG